MVSVTGSSYDRLGILGNHEPAIGDTRWCPDCGRPQHYTGTEAGWCHDAAIEADCLRHRALELVAELDTFTQIGAGGAELWPWAEAASFILKELARGRA